MYKTSAVNGNI